MKKLLLLLMISGCCQQLHSQKLVKKDLQLLRNWMQGQRSNLAQSKSDSSFSLSGLRMQQVWPKRRDGYWIYSEQSSMDDAASVEKQRMYHLYLQDDSTIVCQVFEFKERGAFIGWWQYPRRFDTVKFFALSSRPGCEIFFRKNKKGQFQGGTEGKECLSGREGGYSTAEITVDNTLWSIWDRGWDAKQKQVWGHASGPFEFRRNLKSGK